MANGDLHKLGTFYKANVKQLVPTNPWRSGSTPGGGNIPVFSAGQSLEIRDTDPDNAYQLRWREVNIGSKKLLIADRNILEQVSWDDLNAQNLIFGKNVTIDGQQYKLRVLTGGEERREGGTGSSYEGGKLPNEWDDIIVNEGGYAGLPNPTASDLDTNLNNADRDGAHNQFWNWYYMFSWMQETYLHSGSYRAFRGYYSARSWDYGGQSGRNITVGWRPVLEVLPSLPKRPEPLNENASLIEVKESIQSLVPYLSETKKYLGYKISEVDETITLPTDPTFQQLADGIGQIVTGMKYAVGTTTSSGTYLTVEGLPFRPTMFIAIARGGYTSRQGYSIYIEPFLFNGDQREISSYVNASGDTFVVTTTVTNNSIGIQASHNNVYDWIAFG